MAGASAVCRRGGTVVAVADCRTWSSGAGWAGAALIDKPGLARATPGVSGCTGGACTTRAACTGSTPTASLRNTSAAAAKSFDGVGVAGGCGDG